MKLLKIIFIIFSFISISISIRNDEYNSIHHEKLNRNKIKSREIKSIKENLKLNFSLRQSNNILQIVGSEKIILEKLYKEWNGNEWYDNSNWLEGDPCTNNWYGIECIDLTDGSGGSAVVSIDLQNNNLSGNFFDEFSGLIHLEKLELGNNIMSGVIPNGVFQNMNKLQYMSLNDNSFEGDLTWALYLPLSIKTLWIALNQFSGEIADFSKYENLDLLFLEENLLEGTIPPHVGSIPKIRLLDFGINSLHGSLPDELGNLKTLEQFWLYDNFLSGSIPKTFSNLKNLTLFETSRNQFSGSLDGVFTDNPNLYSIKFSGNQFSGSLDWLCILPNVSVVNFNSNNFTSLPDCTTNIPTNITEFVFSNNQLTGTIPESIGYFKNMTFFNIANNNIGGFVPKTFKNLNKLTRIALENNNFTCTLSEIIDPIKYHTQLTIVSAHTNKITGEFTEDMVWDSERQIELLTKMFIINLAQNYLSGELNEYISWMPNLDTLDLSYNNFSGAIPKSLNYLSTLYLEGNPYLASGDGTLPDFMKPSDQMIHSANGESFSCPQVIGNGNSMRVTLDPSYYNHTFCKCDINYRGSNGTCFLCPEDSFCPGGGNQILIPTGYFPFPSIEDPEYLLKCGVSNFGFTPCNPDNGYNFTCAEGYEDRLCSKCQSGYYRKGVECANCPTGSVQYVIFVIVVLIFIGLFLYFVLTDPKRSLPSSTRKTLMYYYQVFNLLLSKLSPWPSFFSAFYSGSSWLNFSFGFLCINRFSAWPNLYVVMLCLPFVFFFLSVIFIFGMQLYKYIKTKTIEKRFFYSGVRVNLLMLNFLYLPLCNYLFENFPCDKDENTGESYMSFFPYIQCSNDNHTYITVQRVTIAFTIIYIVGIPLLFATLLFYNRKRLDHPNVLLMVGSIYIDYRKSVYWYELVAVGRRFFMAVSLALIDPKSSFSIFVVLLVVGSSIVTQLMFKPYVYKISNFAEVLGNSVLLFSYVCILILASLKTTNLYDSKGIEIILSVVVVLYTILLLLLFLFSLKYFLPKKWQLQLDSKIIKVIFYLRDISDKYMKNGKTFEDDPDEDSFETNKEPIFERTVSNLEVRRRNTRLSSIIELNNMHNNNNNNSNSNIQNHINSSHSSHSNHSAEQSPKKQTDVTINVSVNDNNSNNDNNNNDNNNNNNNYDYEKNNHQN
ncbi:hypothetical protein DICPUDRAFT_80038 [Dictyostelium purpureum]|uniref:Uncharacterized protein n=1 Tax=Dictyostelium purpureum TaxID=5786 RepID=F0ZPC3_DICPU|nr:uncharacterized protein DICPUDRAFT_80038 [Dictyostelium purpureum]EGC34208.1 hypothetical protein DICPUDRAFT_80038 [Dictyostelium purpureum]|eukprot:XP_003289260.1 hypothetical protein DICPUDRAFT_80038 [Dictyostelium purpureum]